jgi:hypothetical protein
MVEVVVVEPPPISPAPPAAKHAGFAAPVVAPTVLKALDTFVPVSATARMQTAAIRPSTSAYSRRVAPRSLFERCLGLGVGGEAINLGFGTDSDRLQALVRTLSGIAGPLRSGGRKPASIVLDWRG